MKNMINKYLTRRNRNIIAIVVIILGIGFFINYFFFEPTYINEYIATNIYKEPANSYFDDENFYKCVVDAYNITNKTSLPYTTNLSDSQLETITELDCAGDKWSDSEKINNTKGLEKITNLRYLYITENKLTELNVQENIYLQYLYVAGNQLTELDLSKNFNLARLDIGYWCKGHGTNSMGGCDLGNQITELDLTNNVNLWELNISNNPLTTLDLSNSTSLKYIVIRKTPLTELDLSNTAVMEVNIMNNDLQQINLGNNNNLKSLKLDNNKLTSLDLTYVDNLEVLYATQNNLTNVTLGQKEQLSSIYLSKNKLTNIDVSGVTNLKFLDLGKYCYSVGSNGSCPVNDTGNIIEKLDLSKNIYLRSLYVNDNNLTELNLNNNKELVTLNAYSNNLSSIDLSNNNLLNTIYLQDNKLDNIIFGDTSNLTDLVVKGNLLKSLNLSNAENLVYLNAYDNQLENVNIQNPVKLQTLNLIKNKLKNIDISDAVNLVNLYLGGSPDTNTYVYEGNLLEALDVSNNIKLKNLYVAHNNLSSLDLSGLTNLTTVEAYYNNLKNINIDNASSLNYLYVENNQISDIRFLNNSNLRKINLSNNLIDQIDVSMLDNMSEFSIIYNKLNELDLRKNTNLTSVSVYGNPFLENIYIYKGDSIELQGAVMFPETITNTITWRSYNDDIGTVDGDILRLNKSGNVVVTGNSTRYTSTKNINVIEITSDKYIIDEDSSYILLGTDSDIDNIQNNINISHDDVELNFDNYKLYVKYGDEILKEFDVIGFSSEEYDLSNDYIYVGSDELDLSNINTINCNKVVNNNKLLIKLGEEIIKEYNIVSISSDLYDLNNDYIYVGTNNIDNNKINVINGTSEVMNDKLVIKYNDELLDEYLLVSISSELYDLSKDYIYIGITNINLNNISVINGTSDVIEDKFIIKYNDIVLDEYLLVSISSELYDLNKNHIYTGSKFFDSSKINVINGTGEVIEDKFIIKYNDDILYEYPIIKIYSDVYEVTDDYIHTKDGNFKHELMLSNYELSMTLMDKLIGESSRVTYIKFKYENEEVANFLLIMYWSDTYNLENDYIYVGTSDLDLSLIKNNCTDISLKIEDNMLKINYNEKTLREIEILSIKFNNYNIYGNKVAFLDELSYRDFVSDIEVTQGITYKLYNGEEEVTSGNIEKDMIFKIYYNGIEVDEYIFTDEYLEFDDSLDVDNDNSIINNIKSSTVIEDILGKINTSGNVSVFDKNGNVIEDNSIKIGTGYKFKIEMSSNVIEYVVSVRGDINGDGMVNINDAVGVSRHVIKGNYLEGIEYINASDVNSDDKVDINDVIRLAKHIVNKSEL